MVTFLYDVAGLSHQMMYEKMPDNDRRKNKCTSIYIDEEYAALYNVLANMNTIKTKNKILNYA